MALKFKYQAKDEVPAEVLNHYVEREGAWVLDAEGATDKSKADEVMGKNGALLKQIEELNKRFEGIDPEEVRKLAEEKQRLEEERQLKAGELDKVVENRVKGLRADWEKQVTTLNAEREALDARLTAIQIDQGVITAATKRSVNCADISTFEKRAWLSRVAAAKID